MVLYKAKSNTETHGDFYPQLTRSGVHMASGEFTQKMTTFQKSLPDSSVQASVLQPIDQKQQN